MNEILNKYEAVTDEELMNMVGGGWYNNFMLWCSQTLQSNWC